MFDVSIMIYIFLLGQKKRNYCILTEILLNIDQNDTNNIQTTTYICNENTEFIHSLTNKIVLFDKHTHQAKNHNS